MIYSYSIIYTELKGLLWFVIASSLPNSNDITTVILFAKGTFFIFYIFFQIMIVCSILLAYFEMGNCIDQTQADKPR